jgi:molybdopterin-guanine dinucleotide biosynthesis protein A
MRQRFLVVSGFILAGGDSHRMGKPKDQLELGGEIVLERQVRLVHSVTRSVAVLGPMDRLAGTGFNVIPDDRPGGGPLGGILTALRHTRSDYNLIVGCDLPFLEARFLRYLCARALTTEAEVTVPESPGREIHPTCAVYRRQALRAARGGLERGDFSARGFFPRVRVQVLCWAEITRAGFSARNLVNMNTPEEFHAARLRLDWQTRSLGPLGETRAAPKD